MGVIPAISTYLDELVAIRRDLHAHPELGFEEVRTAGIVAAKLESWGIEVHKGIGKTGVVGVLRGRRDGNRSIGLRADMDALPMEEMTDLPFKSTIPGKFHGCGHDVHTTMLLGAARYLAETRDFAGTVVFIFQPAEEGLGGAKAMIADGLFERFPCDELYGMHNFAAAPAGQFSIMPGMAQAGADFFDVRIKGRGSHAAMPELSRDPVIAAASYAQALQTIVSRNLSALKSAVVSITQIHAGTAYNVVPDRAVLSGTIRHFDDAVAETVRERMRVLADGTARMFDVEVEVDIRDVFVPLYNDPEMTSAYAEAASEVVGTENVLMRDQPFMGSEDFSYMLAMRPGAYCMLGHGSPFPAHTPGFVVNEAIIPVGASLYARIAENRLGGRNAQADGGV